MIACSLCGGAILNGVNGYGGKICMCDRFKPMTKDEALKMAIDGLEIHQKDILDACKEALEQPTQEPVAWMSEEVLPLNHIIKAVVRREPDEQYTIPLYTHPKEWQGLSDDEIFSMCPYTDESMEEAFYRGARAYEAKSKEKHS